MTRPTREQLEDRCARLARRLGQIALREHQRLHGRTSLAACTNADCRRTYDLIEKNAPEPSDDAHR